MLHTADRHLSLASLATSAWDAAAVHAALQALVNDLVCQRRADGNWPLHPRDDAGDTPSAGFQGVYLGRAGVDWALWALQQAGALDAPLPYDPVAGLAAAHATYLTSPDSGTVVPSYHMGESGILLLWWRASGSAAVADRLYHSVEGNLAHPSNEAFWGTSGTLVPAFHLWAATGETRWRDLVMACAERLWQTWAFDEAASCHLWTQDLYGKSVQYLGAGHGLAGNVHALLKAAALLDDERRADLLQRTRHALARLAVHEDGAVNWPPGTYTPRPDAPRLLMQWCHGAPGFVTGLADYPAGVHADVDALLLGAGEAVWRAGPLAKGYGLCHGTAGNGQALLLLHQRNGDPRWLDRARQFAMAALAQRAAALAAHDGLGRACLWTGDPGLALYLWQCLQARAGMPGLDWLA